jgi:hypothetical protein
MPLFAIAGGAPSGEGIFFCCCGPPFLLLLFLSAWGVTRGSLAITWAAFVLTCVPFLILLNGVIQHEPSDDWEVEAEQVAAVRATCLYGVLLAGMGVAVIITFWQNRRKKTPQL